MPPRIAKWIVSRFALYERNFALSHALDDDFLEIRAQHGTLVAWFWYWFHTLEISSQYIRVSIVWSFVMLKSYFKITIRNMIRQKGYSFMTITGLSIGIACAILIVLYVNHELSYDKYHKDAERIYRIPTIVKSAASERPFARGLTPLIPVLLKEYPEVESAARFIYLSTSNVRMEYGEKILIENTLMATDSRLFEVFSIPFLSGDAATALERPNTIVITRDIAAKFFEGEALGKILIVNGEAYEITGVVEDAPDNTHLTYDIMLSLKTMEGRLNLQNWGWTGFYSYVKLNPKADPDVFEQKIRKIAHNYIGEALDELGIELILFLQPLTEIHLHSDLHREIKPPGNATYIYIFSVVGMLVLLVACMNFVNLTTARSMKRAMEIGVRKVMGAQRFQLIWQFVGEFLFMAVIALVLAMCLTGIVLPEFSELSGKQFELTYFLQPAIAAALFSIILFVAIAACSYPALFLSGFKPARIIQSFAKMSLGSGRIRKIMVVWQFAISIALIIGTLLIRGQIDFMKSKQLGFEKEHKLILPVNLGDRFESVKSEFLSYPAIKGATASASVPGRISNSLVTRLVGDEDAKGQTILFNFVDDDFISEYGLELVAGGTFRQDMSSGDTGAFIINEAAARTFGFSKPEDAIGKQLTRGSNQGNIVGVIKDFHFQGLQSEIRPHILQLVNGSWGFNMLSLTISSQNIPQTIDFIEAKWQELQLGDTFDYFFLDEDFDRLYNSEERMGTLFSLFTFLGIFIAIIGLFGLSSFTTQQRTREIGIRKVLGASTSGLVLLMSREFTKWVLLANIIAWPAAYIFATKWLQHFAYRIDIQPWMFLASGAFALALAILTVGLQATKSASANPVDSLRYE